MPKQIKSVTLSMTEQEINECRYALNELANKRQEQAIDCRYKTGYRTTVLQDACNLRQLADRLSSLV